MKHLKHFVYTFLLLSMFGCSSDIPEPIIPPVEVDTDFEIIPTTNIRYTGDMEEEEETRAGGVIDPSTAIAVSLFRTDVTYPTAWTGISALPANIAANGTVTFGTTQYYAANGNNTKVIGVYPAEGTGATWSASAGTMTYTIDGYTDIMATSFAEANKTTSQPALTFDHLLTQIEVTVIGEDATAIGLWGTVNSVSVTGRQNSCVVTLPKPNLSTAPTTSFSGSAALPVRTKAGAVPSATTVTTAEKTFGYCMFAPITTSSTLTLSVVTSLGGTTTVTVPAKVYAKGTSYKIQLKMTKTSIVPTATITAWTSGGATTVVTL